jgi:hypothetical protein
VRLFNIPLVILRILNHNTLLTKQAVTRDP